MKKPLILLIILCLCACSNVANRANVNPNSQPNDVAHFQDDAEDTEVLAETLAKKVTGLDGIKSARVLVNGNTAIVGIDLTERADDIKLVATKRIVEDAVREIVPNFERIAVTAAPELVEKITKISEHTKKPPSYKKDLEEIISSLTPLV